MNGKVTSPLRYPGGKSRFVDVICPLLGDFDEYGEPMCGGASIFYGTKSARPDAKFWINDKFEDLYYFYVYSRDDNDALRKVIQAYFDSHRDMEQTYHFIRDNGSRLSKFERFADVMKNCKHRFIISYDDTEHVRKMFSFANIVNFKMHYGSKHGLGEHRYGKELLITSFDVGELNHGKSHD